MPSPPSLVAFSHLRWDFVFQRPQHLLTRLAATRPVFYVEEPVHDPHAEAHFELTRPAPNVTVCRPHTPHEHGGFGGTQFAALKPLVEKLVAEQVKGDYDLWLYTPMALPLTSGLRPGVTVYDKMDDLSAFKFAPAELSSLEAELLAKADVVFTGGPSLYRVTRDRHANCHCFSSSVEAAHFAQAATALTEPADQAGLPRPRLGFYGVIDERFDLDLLSAVAAMRPAWQFVMVGPVVKIDPAQLPRRANIHYPGQKGYAELPAYLSGWDVALLPFARNDSTRLISPTKVLEYMAALKPIVSTRIADIAEPYGAMVGLADTAPEFVAACERALTETPSEKIARERQFRGVLARTSWDSTAAAMAELVEVARARRAKSVAARTAGLAGPAEDHPVVVIGAGPTGLSATYHLGDDALLIEAEGRVGGWCRSIVDNGFTFDFAGHIMFSNDPYVHKMYETLLGDNVHWQDREAWVYSKNVYTRYPFQGALYGLPADVIKECILGAIEARYGADKKPVPAEPKTVSLNGSLANGNGHANGNGKSAEPQGKASPQATCAASGSADPKDVAVSDCCADGIAESTVPLVKAAINGKSLGVAAGEAKPAGPRNFEEFIYQVWGAGIAKHFAIPYNRKIWAVPLDEMETSWLGGRVPMPDLGEMLEGALQPKGKPMGPNARFGYPLKGGFQALMDGFLPHIQDQVRLNSRIKAVSPSRHVLTLDDGGEVGYEQLISTMPLPVLVKCMGDEAPEFVRQAAKGLRHTSVRCVNIGVGREKLTEKHWIYYPEDTVFHRIFVQGNASPHCNPAGGFGLTCEITYGLLKPLPCDGEDLIRRCIADCIKVGFFNEGDPILATNQVDMPFAYVVYDHARAANVKVIREWLLERDIHLSGRYR